MRIAVLVLLQQLDAVENAEIYLMVPVRSHWIHPEEIPSLLK